MLKNRDLPLPHDSMGALPRICVVGPMPPPSGGMANQCEQLVRLLRSEGLEVELVRNNLPCRPLFIERIPVVRACFRLVPFLLHLWQAAGRADVMHVLANSGWAWHLFAAPAVIIAKLRATPVIINYRGGSADSFFSNAPSFVLKIVGRASMRVTPSVYLQRVFVKHGLSADVIPNIIDLSRFALGPQRAFGNSPHIIVTRNLEQIYDIPTAIRAFAIVKKAIPGATMTVAGSGPELANLHALVAKLGLAESIEFSGRIENASIPRLYSSADCMINSSTVDNMPISILEAFASGVPVITTDAGGIPDLVDHQVTGMLAPVGDAEGLARETLRVLQNPTYYADIRRTAHLEAQKYSWQQVRERWLAAYVALAHKRSAA